MREKSRRLIVSLTASVLFVLGLATASLAESGLPPTVTLSPEAPGPGAVVAVSGIDFPTESPVDLLLITNAGVTQLGTVTSSPTGTFRQSVTMPSTVAEGWWELRATGPQEAIAVRLFMPSAAVAAAPDPATVGAAGAAEGAAEAARADGPAFPVSDLLVVLIIVGLIAGIGAAAVFTWRASKRKDGDPGMPAGDDPIWSSARGPR